MRWPRHIRPRRLRRQRAQRDALSPLLRAVEKEAPPEGLLLRIEQELDNAPTAPPKPRRGKFAAAAAMLIGAGLLLAVPRHHVALIDQSGRPIVNLTTSYGVTTAQMVVAPVLSDVNMSWHLWGVSDGAPVHLGALSDGGLALENADQFAHFAVSLENATFMGGQPVGPVVELSAQEN